MALPSSSRLAIAELVFYLPAFVLSIIVSVRHGFRRELGWFYLVLLALVRLIGNSMEIAGHSENNTDLFVGAAVLNGVGLSPLLLAMLAMLERLNGNLLQGPLHRILKLLRVPIVVALILTAYGGSQLYGQTSPSDYKQGEHLARAGIILMLVTFAAMTLITAVTYSRLQQIRTGEIILLYAATVSIPFILIRLIYSALVYLDTHSKTFNITGGNIWARALMAVLTEWITVILYTAAGLMAPKIAGGEVKGLEMGVSGLHRESETNAAPPRYNW